MARRRPARRADPRTEERHQAFLEAATEVFLAHGFENATLGDVITRSGGSRATLYSRFGSKEGLFAALIESKCAQIVAALDSEQMEGRLDEVLGEFATVYMRELMSAESLALFRLVIGESGRFPELGAAVFQAGPNAAAKRLASYLHSHVETGALKIERSDVDVIARQFLEMVKGDLHVRALMRTSPLPTRKEVAHCIETAVHVFLNGVQPRRKSGE